MRFRQAALASIFLSSTAGANQSWYQVENYSGTLGEQPVHISIQQYDFSKNSNIRGIYYYDKYRSPIALYGIKSAASVYLCEAHNKVEQERYNENSDRVDFTRCPFQLTDENGTLKGIWKNERREYPVVLRRTATMSPTSVQGTLDIPFLGQTEKHAFIGRYEASDSNVTINKVQVIDKASGKTLQVIDPNLYGCDFGFYMTTIYRGIEDEDDKSQVWFNCYSTGGDKSVLYRFDKQVKRYRVMD